MYYIVRSGLLDPSWSFLFHCIPKSISMFFLGWNVVTTGWRFSVQLFNLKPIKVLWSDLGSCLEAHPVGSSRWQGVPEFVPAFFGGGVSNNWTKKQQQRDLQRWRSMVFFAGLIGWIAMMKMKTSTTCWWTLGCIRLDFLLVDLVDRDDGTVSDSLRWHVECVIYLTRHYKLQDHVFESCLMASSKSGEKLWRQNLLRAPMPEAMLCMKDVSTAKSIRKMWMHVMRWV